MLLEPNESDGWNEAPVERDMQAGALASLLAQGYYIMQISYEEERVGKEKQHNDATV